MLIFEFIRFYRKKVFEDIINIDSETKSILLSKDAFILMTAHLGNWEMILPIISKYRKITAVVRDHKNMGGNKFFSEFLL